MSLSALDARSGERAWTRPFAGIPSSRVYAAGEAVVFTTVQPNRIWMFEADTGRRTGPDTSHPEGLASQVAYVAADLLVLVAEGRSMDAYELPSGRLRWKAPLPQTTLRAVEVAGDDLYFLAMRRKINGPEEGGYVARLSLKSGKLLRVADDLGSGDPRYLALGSDALFILSREPDGGFQASARALSDLAIRWTSSVKGGKDATLTPPALAAGHLVVTSFEQGADGKYGYAADVLDMAGKAVQYIRSAREFERPPVGTLVPAGLVFSVDSRVDVWR
jgi:outer membrane protein assembly factor BamB